MSGPCVFLLQTQHHAPEVVSLALHKLTKANVRELGLWQQCVKSSRQQCCARPISSCMHVFNKWVGGA